MKVDYIIVGLGLAGLAFSRELVKHNKTFIVFEDSSQHSSKVAGGMYNPIVLKRFTPVWDAKNQLEKALPFYKELEELLGGKYDYKVDVFRLFTSIEEQNNWFAASDNPVLSDYLIPKVVTKKYNGIESPFGYGNVTKTGRLDTLTLLNDYRKHLEKENLIVFEKFDHDTINFDNEKLEYKGINATKVVFCEGFGMKKNPFFKTLPMEEAKGEMITIHAPELEIDFVLKSSVFIMPLGNDLYKIGATFAWDDTTSIPTEKAKKELIEKLNKIISVPYKVVDHVAGIRPTVRDRRPLVGIHNKHQQLVILNGLGTRGVMIAPTVAKELYSHIENGLELRKEINISRFYN
jgi:glycine/D-amino acid oxidase-like deaminating enzyme